MFGKGKLRGWQVLLVGLMVGLLSIGGGGTLVACMGTNDPSECPDPCMGDLAVFGHGVFATAPVFTSDLLTPNENFYVTGQGVVRVRINSDDLRTGTTLGPQPNTANAGIRLTLNGQPQWSIATVLGGDFQIYDETGQVNRLFIETDTGNVGIGTENPASKLELKDGELRVTHPGSLASGRIDLSSPNGMVGIALFSAETNGWRRDIRTDDSGLYFALDSTTSIPPVRVTIDNGGNVGIGTQEPQEKLDVVGHIRTQGGTLRLLRPDTAGGWARGLQYLTTDGSSELGGIGLLGSGTSVTRFYMAHGSDPWRSGKGLYIDKAGNIGIGTTNPEERLHVIGSILKTGTVSFVQPHPTDSTREIVYVSLEGPEAGTYIRGTAQLVNGEAVIELPEHFSWVTNDESLTVQLTPRSEWLQLYLVETSTKRIIVREASGKSGQFDYLVQGVRKGYEHYQVIQERK